jgi:hypothetical protein
MSGNFFRGPDDVFFGVLIKITLVKGRRVKGVKEL